MSTIQRLGAARRRWGRGQEGGRAAAPRAQGPPRGQGPRGPDAGPRGGDERARARRGVPRGAESELVRWAAVKAYM